MPAPSTASSPGVASTGQMFTLWRPASSGETNRPSEICTTRCTEISDSPAPPPRLRAAGTSAVLCTQARTSTRPSWGSERSVRRPPGSSTVARSPIATGPSSKRCSRAS